MTISTPEGRDLRVVIAGGGTVGRRTAQLLHDRGHEVVVVEPDRARAEELSDSYIASIIVGDASRPSILRQAGPERCDVLAALTGDEPTNFAICTAAQRMAEVHTVMRIEREPDELYSEFVDGLVFPESLGARAAANEIAGVGVRTLEDVTSDLEILEIEVADAAPVAGKALDAVRLPSGTLVVADSEGGRVGTAETVLEPGHRYILAVESDVADEVMRLFRG